MEQELACPALVSNLLAFSESVQIRTKFEQLETKEDVD